MFTFMRKTTTTFFKLLVSTLVLGSASLAQAAYVPVALTGFTSDVVANGTGTAISSTTDDVDGGTVNNRFCFMAPNFVNPTGATPTTSLPASGLINSMATSGLAFQLAPYTGNNSLRINGIGTGSLAFATPRPAQDVYLLAVSGNGASTVTVTVTFTDATTQVFTAQTVADWFGGSGFAVQGIGRVNRDNNAIQNNTTDPRLYQIRLTLLAANYTKSIQSVSFNKPAALGTLNVMAISVQDPPAPLLNDDPCGAVALTSSPQIGTNINATTSVQNGITFPACTPSQSPRDVWFAFTPAGTSTTLTLTGTAAGMVRLFTSPQCANGPFTQVGCQAATGSNAGFTGPITFSGLTAGTRYYVAVSGYGSADTPGNFTIAGSNLLASRTRAETNALTVHPNPSNTGQLTLRLDGFHGAGQVSLLNALGQVVLTKALTTAAEQVIATRGLAAGVYTLQVEAGAEVLTRKVVLE
jgi:hypothetical protein